MNKPFIKYCILVFAYLVVLYPIWVNVGNLAWSFNSTIVFNLFPLFGLVAFTLLWLHVISGVFEQWLRKYIEFDFYMELISKLIFFTIILHPLLLLINAGFKFGPIFLYGKYYIWLGIIGWLFLITYDIGKALKNQDFFVRNWNKIRLISTVGFLLIFFHSLGVGDDLQVGALRVVWIFYGTTGILATIYIHGIKRFLL